jgi:hypothetical protein
MFFITNTGATTIDDIAKEFPVIYSKLSKLASSSVSAMSVDSAGMLLSEVKKRIKGVHTILRINSSGMVINEVSQSGSTVAMRSVGDQKWFIDIKDKNTAYFGSSREAGGNYLLFWAWPTQTGSGSFGGVLAVKFDVSSICQGICSDSVHFAAFYNENLLYRCGNDRFTFREVSEWLLPDSSKITLRCSAMAVVAGVNEINKQEGIETEKSQIAEPVKNNIVVPKVNDNSESRKQIETRGRKNGGSNLLLYVLLFIVLVSGFLLFQAKFNKRTLASLVNRDTSDVLSGSHDENNSEVLSSASLSTEMVDADEAENVELMDEVPESSHEEIIVQTKDNADTQETVKEHDVHDETGPLSAEEACEKIKELIGDSGSESFQSVSLPTSLSSTDDAIRKELYREIHGQIIHWVTCESTRLSQSLKELSDRVGKLENVNDPEVIRIRSEANRISKEISAFKDNPSGQVSE